MKPMTKDASTLKAKLLLTWLKDSTKINMKPEDIAVLFAQTFGFPTSIAFRSVPERDGSTHQRMTVKIGTQIYEFKRVFKNVFGQKKIIKAWESKANWPVK